MYSRCLQHEIRIAKSWEAEKDRSCSGLFIFPLEYLFSGSGKGSKEYLIVAFGGEEERGENAPASWDTSWECPCPAPRKKRNRVQSGCFKGSLRGGRLKACFVFSSAPR